MKALVAAAAIAAFVLPARAQWFQPPKPSPVVGSRAPSFAEILPAPQDPDSLVRIIVEFQEPPLFSSASRPGLGKADRSLYQRRFDQFSADLAGSSVRSSAAGVQSTQFSRTYFKTFFGVSMTVPASMMTEILALAYVKTVHIDKPVRAFVDKSAVQMQVPQVWQTFGSQGAGVRVGIIDTGIDYLHPALGGGFGPGFKVVGGYDFVNNDPDPRDDEGHGTHVAGIVAADTDSVKGMAPKVSLYAYKVLDETGGGTESDVIAAIERSADPDDNGDPSDRLDVVNLSLGTFTGTPTDPSAVAVNVASETGVIFCIAAGNSGYVQTGGESNYYQNGSATIGSPGTAEQAITVGAVDSVEALARFSSKGPNRNTFGIKPDVVAPGVMIVSSVLNNAYARYNGTSMATPMVAGVAALLRSIHPNWPADRIKSAIINTGRDAGTSTYWQGGGRVRALTAASSTAWIKPRLLSFGLDNPSSSVWTRQDTLIIYNVNAGSQTFSTSVTGTQSGITITVSPSGVTIPAGDSAMVVVNLSVNNSVIPAIDDNIPLYTGFVRFLGNTDTLNVPWGFARARRLRLVFNEPNPSFVIFGGPRYYQSQYGGPNWVNPTTAEVYGIPQSTNDFVFVFKGETTTPKIVIRQSYSITSDDHTMTVNTAEATVPFVFQGVDHKGDRLSGYRSSKKAVVIALPQFGDWVAQFSSKTDTVRMSPVSSSYIFRPMEYQFDASSSGTFHIVQYPKQTGVQNPVTLANSSSNFIPQEFVMKFAPSTPQALLAANFSYYRQVGEFGFMMGMGTEIDTVAVANGEAKFMGYFGRSHDPLTDAAIWFYRASDLADPSVDLITQPIMISRDSILSVPREMAWITTPHSPPGKSMTFGGPPVHLNVLWYNNIFGESGFHFSTNFQGMLREFRYGDEAHGTYTVYDANGNVVISNPLNDYPRSSRTLTPSWYKTVMTSSNYWLRGIRGTLTETSEFSLATTPANPPSITSFLVLDGRGQPTHSLPPGGAGSLMFSAMVVNFIDESLPVSDSTKAWYRIHGTTEWIPLTIQSIANDLMKDGAVFRADLAPALSLDSAAVDLRVFAKESRGYSVDLEIVPAFAVGTWGGESPTSVKTVENIVPAGFTLHQNYPNPFNASSNFKFEIREFALVSLKIYDLLGREIVTLVQEPLAPGVYTTHWNAGTLPTGMYVARLTAGSETALRKVVLLK